MLSIIIADDPPNLPEVAKLYSQLAGVLAGFGFGGIIALFSTQLTTSHSAARTLESGGPLLAAFLALVLSSVNYAVVGGETAGTPRVAALQTLSGLGFGAAGIMLIYSMLIFIRGLEHDVAASRNTSRKMADMVRALLVFAICPLIVLLMWSGVRDHVIQKYVDPEFQGIDWASLATLAIVAIASFALRFNFSAGHHTKLTQFISVSAVLCAVMSALGATALIGFTSASDPVPDTYPLVAVLLTGIFAVIVIYSSLHYTTEPYPESKAATKNVSTTAAPQQSSTVFEALPTPAE